MALPRRRTNQDDDQVRVELDEGDELPSLDFNASEPSADDDDSLFSDDSLDGDDINYFNDDQEQDDQSHDTELLDEHDSSIDDDLIDDDITEPDSTTEDTEDKSSVDDDLPSQDDLNREIQEAKLAAEKRNSEIADTKRKKVKKQLEKNLKNDTVDKRHSRKTSMEDNSDKKIDRRKQANIFRIFIIAVVIVIVGLAIFNVIVPKQELTESDVQSIASAEYGDTGFPLTRGQGVATQFMQAYLMLGGDASSSKLLDVFYNGKTSADAQSSQGATTLGNANITGNVGQRIEYGPYVYSSKSLTPKTGDYTIGALVYQVDTTSGAQVKDGEGNVIYKWMFFDVGVYYDSKSDSFLISKDSPNIIPDIKTIQQANAPDTKLPGDGQEDKSKETTPMTQTLTDYMDAWASSKQSTLSTMTTPDRTSAALQGMNGLVSRAGDLSYKIYGPVNNDGYYRALVTVAWKDTVTGDSSIGYQSKYILYVKPISDKKYLIKDIQPYQYYVASDASISSSGTN